jgi:hypothetical protein
MTYKSFLNKFIYSRLTFGYSYCLTNCTESDIDEKVQFKTRCNEKYGSVIRVFLFTYGPGMVGSDGYNLMIISFNYAAVSRTPVMGMFKPACYLLNSSSILACNCFL